MKKSRSRPYFKLRWLLSAAILFFGLSLLFLLKSGTGPLSFLADPSSVNETKTICTRRTDGKKVCTNYSTGNDGAKTTSTKIISDVVDANKKIVGTKTEYEYKVEAKTDKTTGNTTTVEVRKKFDRDTGTETKLSQITTIQDQDRKVLSDVREGDFTVGVTVDKPATPAVIVDPSVNIPKGDQCETIGSPVNSGTWVASGRGWVNGTSSREAGTTQRECVKCDNGRYSGSKACDELIASGDPVVLPFDGGQPYTGVEGKTGSCLTKEDKGWALMGFGTTDNSGRICGMSGEWVDQETFTKDLTAVCSAKGLQSSGGKCVSSSAATSSSRATPTQPSLPNVASRKPATCTTGLSQLAGREVYIKCSANGYPAYTFCSGGKLDAIGNCIPTSISEPSKEYKNVGQTCPQGDCTNFCDKNSQGREAYKYVDGKATCDVPPPIDQNTGFSVSNQGFDVKVGGTGVGVDTGKVGISAYLDTNESKVAGGTLIGAATGATACAATGVLTLVSPICGVVGGAIGWYTAQQLIK